MRKEEHIASPFIEDMAGCIDSENSIVGDGDILIHPISVVSTNKTRVILKFV